MNSLGDPTVLAAVIGAAGVMTASMIGMVGMLVQRNHRDAESADILMRRVEKKIDGIRDGTMPEIKSAIAQLLKERTLSDLDDTGTVHFGRREGDAAPNIVDPATPGKVIEIDGEGDRGQPAEHGDPPT